MKPTEPLVIHVLDAGEVQSPIELVRPRPGRSYSPEMTEAQRDAVHRILTESGLESADQVRRIVGRS